MKRFLKKDTLFIIILFLITLIVYFPAFEGRLFFDDEYFILRNVHVHSLENIPKLFINPAGAGAGHFGTFYRPMQFVFHTFIFSLFEANPLAHHLLSILFHFGCGILLFYLIKDFRISRKIAFFSSLLFLIHPVNTQAVSYVSGLGEPLGLFFLLSSLIVYRKREYLYKKLGNISTYSLFSILMIFSFLSKEKSLIFLLLFLLVDISYPAQNKKSYNSLVQSIKQSFKKNRIYYLIIIASSFFYWVLRFKYLNFGEMNFITSSMIYNKSLLIRFYSFLYSFFEYLKIIFFPKILYSERAFIVIESFFNLKVVFSFLVICIFFFISIYKFKTQKPLFLGFFWFIVSLIPTSGVIVLFYTMKEHWLYYSMVGFSFMFVFYFFKLIKNKKIALIILVILIIFLSIRTFNRNSDWANPEKFFINELKYNPNSENAIANLAYEYYLQGKIDDAIKLYEKGINVTTSSNLAMMYYNLGYMNYLKGNITKAVFFYHKSLEVNPYYYYALQELSKYYFESNDSENFNKYYSRLIEMEKRIN